MRQFFGIFTALLLITAITFCYFTFMGNPIEKMKANQKAKDYLSTEYGHAEVSVEKITYARDQKAFKLKINMLKPESTSFMLEISEDGSVNDTYRGRRLHNLPFEVDLLGGL